MLSFDSIKSCNLYFGKREVSLLLVYELWIWGKTGRRLPPWEVQLIISGIVLSVRDRQMAFQVGGNILILLIGHPGGEKKHLRIEKQTFRGMPCIFNCILTIACASFMMKLGKNIFCFLDNDIRQTNVWYSTGSILVSIFWLTTSFRSFNSYNGTLHNFIWEWY